MNDIGTEARPAGGREPAVKDGVRMAVLSSRFDSIARKMQNTLFRTGRSGILNTAHDFSCVILTADCRLLTAAESLPSHVMIGPDIMARYVMDCHPAMPRGARRRADRRARAADARPRGRLGHAGALCRGLVRLQRAAHGRGHPPAAQWPGHGHLAA